MNIGINTPSMAELSALLPLIVPFVLIQLIIAGIAVSKIVRQKQFKYLNKVSWLIIVVFVQLIGPICYFIFGKGDE